VNKKNKKKILMFMPSIEGGGVEKNLFIVSNFLIKKFNQVTLITISKKYKKKFNKSINFISLSSDIWDKLGRRFKYFLAIVLLIKEICKNKDLIVFSFQANIYCIIVCKIFSVKIVSRSNSAPYGWSKNWVKRGIFRFFLNSADKILVNSEQFKKDLKKEFNVNAVCIYNPLNQAEIKKRAKKKVKKIFNTRNKIKILNIGRFTDQKDQITLLKSLNLLKNHINYEAVIIGKGILKFKLKKYIIENKLNNYIKIINFVENPYNLIKQTDIFILSSKYEGLPNVLLESLALKKFIISSDCPTGPREILVNGRGGLLFKMGNYKELSKKIIYYSKNKKKCNKMLKLSISNLHRFDYHKNLNKYYNLINSI